MALIKEATYETVTVEQKRQVTPEVHGCDECLEEIKEYPNEDMRLEMTIFKEGDDVERLHFCSWGCVLKYLPKIKSNYFVSLPHLYCDAPEGSKRGIEELKRLTQNL